MIMVDSGCMTKVKCSAAEAGKQAEIPRSAHTPLTWVLLMHCSMTLSTYPWSAHTPLPDSCSVTLSMHSWSAHTPLTRVLLTLRTHSWSAHTPLTWVQMTPSMHCWSAHSTYPRPVDALKRDAEHVLLVSVHLDPVALRAPPACQGHKQSLGHNYGGLLASKESICYYVHVVATVRSYLLICA